LDILYYDNEHQPFSERSLTMLVKFHGESLHQFS